MSCSPVTNMSRTETGGGRRTGPAWSPRWLLRCSASALADRALTVRPAPADTVRHGTDTVLSQFLLLVN